MQNSFKVMSIMTMALALYPVLEYIFLTNAILTKNYNTQDMIVHIWIQSQYQCEMMECEVLLGNKCYKLKSFCLHVIIVLG